MTVNLYGFKFERKYENNYRSYFISYIIFLSSFSVYAAFIDYGNYSRDTKTNLEWLDLTQTANISYYDIKNGRGDWFLNGWRYAKGGEIVSLFSEYIGTPSEAFYFGEAYENALNVIRQLGVSLSFNNPEGVRTIYGPLEPTQIVSTGWFDDETTNISIGIANLTAILPESVHSNPSSSSRWVVYNDFWSNERFSFSGYGSFLVRDSSAIPEPPIILLLSIGIVGIFSTNRLKT